MEFSGNSLFWKKIGLLRIRSLEGGSHWSFRTSTGHKRNSTGNNNNCSGMIFFFFFVKAYNHLKLNFSDILAFHWTLSMLFSAIFNIVLAAFDWLNDKRALTWISPLSRFRLDFIFFIVNPLFAFWSKSDRTTVPRAETFSSARLRNMFG